MCFRRRGLDADSPVGIDARHDGLRELPKRFCQYSRYSAAAVRSFTPPPTNSCSAVVVLAVPAGSNVSSGRAGVLPQHLEASLEQASEWSRISNYVRSREPFCYGSVSELSPSVQRCHNARPLSQSRIEAKDEWELFSPSFMMTSELKA